MKKKEKGERGEVGFLVRCEKKKERGWKGNGKERERSGGIGTVKEKRGESFYFLSLVFKFRLS